MKYTVIMFILLLVLSFGCGFSAVGWNREKIKEDLAENGLQYLSDTLMDVNGDGQNELVVNIVVSVTYAYTLKGICFAGSPDSMSYLFSNPTFYLKEKTVRCVYGLDYYDGIILEKYNWKGNLLDVVEKLVVMEGEEPQYLHDDFTEHITKDKIPAEYFSANGFNCFFRNMVEKQDSAR